MFFDEDLKQPQPVYVTRPWLPELDDYVAKLRPLWESRWLTNHGKYACEFEARIRALGEVEYCRVVSSGTAALVCALEALQVKGEVLVTPLTFVATTHALHWTGSRPVFCDLEPDGWNIDPAQVEAAITSDTEAILAVHLFGYPCQVEALQALADKHGLALVFDAAHATACRYRGRPLVSHGDASILSFHATKALTTLEGGAVMTGSAEVDRRVELLRDFGFDEDDNVLLPGLNAKLNEFQAAMGLLQLDGFEQEIAGRKQVFENYAAALADLAGLELASPGKDCEHNYSYVPVRIDEEAFGASRDDLNEVLRAHNIFGRPYFKPLNSDLPWYRDLPSAQPEHLPNAVRASHETFCLPVYGELDAATQESIVAVIRGVHRERRG